MQKTKRPLSFLLAVLMIVGMFAAVPFTALAVTEGTPLTDQLPSTQGTYYLTQDITISSTWLAPSGATTLDLNGYGIRMTGTGTVIDVCRDASCVLTLNDSRPTYSGGENRPSGILGGYITGGTGSKTHPGTSNASYIVGGGIFVSNAVLNINGGTIYGNSAAWGGGIYINDNCTVNMTGGAITGNSCARGGYGGGVFLSARSTFNVSHTPSIIGNYYSYNGKQYPRNVHMQVVYSGGKPVYAVITIVSPGLTAGAQIGIYEYQTNQYHVTSGYSTYHSGVNPGTYFSCDNDGYAYKVNEGELLSVPAFTITWKNEDGSLIDTTTVAGGTVPTHDAPTKDATAQYTYTFAGWSNGTTTYAPDEALPEVIRDATYTATFNQTDREYTITWKNDDGSVIDTTTVPYGTVPTHADATKDADAQYSYTFAGWDTTPVAVTGDATYTATYTTSPSPAALVIEKINAIGTVEYTDACKAKIDDARDAYDALTDAQKALVTNYQTLLDAEAAYANLKAAAEAAAALAQAKADAKAELANYKDPADYRPAQQTELTNAINAGNDAIDAAASTDDVATALANAKDVIDAIKTDAQMTAEEIVYHGITFQPWRSTDSLPKNGNYYLTGDVTVANRTVPNGTLNLLLNGYTVTMSGSDAIFAIGDRNDDVLSLFDNKGTGKLTGGKGYEAKGGSVYMTAGTFNMYGGTITNSAADYGGGVYIKGGTFNMYDGAITGCKAETDDGGAVYVQSGAFNMYGGTLSNCTAVWYGGGVCVDGGSFDMYDGTISGCSGNYGGVFTYNGGSFRMHDGAITGCTGNYMGGGLTVYSGASFVMDDGVITGCNGGNYGGAAYVSGGCSFVMNGGSIDHNTAYMGSGIYNAGTTTINGGVITDNNATGVGGAVSTGTLNLAGGSIIGNTSDYGYAQDIVTTSPVNVTGQLPADSRFGVYYCDNNVTAIYGTFTNGLAGKGTADNFVNENGSAQYPMGINSAGELQYLRLFTVTWKNGDTVLETDTNVLEGSVPEYNGTTPTKAEDSQYTYTFAGWDNAPAAITGDVTYTATYTTSPSPAALVIEKINAIGTVAYDDASKAKIDDARNAYDALTDTQKALVTNYQTLLDAEAAYQAAAAESVQDWQSVTIADEIYINFIPAVRDDLESITVEYIDQGKVTQTLTFNDPENQLEKYDATHYLIPVEVAPAQIGDTIKATLKITGSDSIALNTSIAEYCKALIAGNYEQKYKDLAAATLEYGQAANDYFSGTGFYTANTFAGTDAATAAVSAVANRESTLTLDENARGKIRSASYMALTKPEFRFYVKNGELTEAQAAALNKKITVSGPKGVKARFVKNVDKDNAIMLEVTGIEAATMDQAVTITIDGFGTITFCGNDFARLLARNDATAVLGAALFNYGVAAKACFIVKEGE